MRIAFLLDGSSRRAFDLARGLVDRGYKVDLVLSRTNRQAMRPLRISACLSWTTEPQTASSKVVQIPLHR